MKNTLRAGYLRAERAPERSTRVLAGGGIRDGSRLVLRIVASSGGRGDRRSEVGAGEAAPAWASLPHRAVVETGGVKQEQAKRRRRGHRCLGASPECLR